MLSKKYLILCLFIYFIGLWIFFNSQFISLQPIKKYSNHKLTDQIQYKQFIKQEQSNQQININIQQQLKQNQNLAVDQVILIIIDALRYDYLSQFKFFSQTIKNHPKTTFIKKALVGLPTMTTQRIESLMTGSQIFSASHIFETFLSSSTKNDNIIYQLHKNNKKVGVFGDDTWTKIFNIQKQNSWVCDSTFNIRDYDSCDDIIYKNVQKHIKKVNNKQDGYQLVISHFLSLDHIGHTTSRIKTGQMKDRMQKMSIFFKHLIEIAKQNTMLIITGDHGMRKDGNHGGNSKDQIQSLLFAYYKPIKHDQQQQQLDFNKRVNKNMFKQSQIDQIDITATLSILLDVQNPINSIGYPIIDILPNKYSRLLRNIQINTLLSYKNILEHYHNKNQNPNQINQCINNITNYIESQLKNNQILSFQRYIQNRQFIKSNIQKSKCLMLKLTMAQPQYYNIILGIILIIIAFSSILLRLLYLQLSRIIIKSSIKYYTKINNITINLILQQFSWIFSLFTVYFSWYLIRNQSSYLLLAIILFTLLFININNQITTIQILYKKTQIILLLVFITQLQPVKINQYELNFMNFQLGKYFQSLFTKIVSLFIKQQNQIYAFRMSKFGKRILQKNITDLIEIIIVSLWFLFKLITRINQLKKIRFRSRKHNNKNNQKYKYKSNKNNILFQIILLSLVYFNLFLSQFLQIKQNNFIYYIRYTIILIIFGYTLLIAYNCTQNYSYFKLNLLLLSLSSIYFSCYEFLPLIVFVKVIQKLLDLSVNLYNPNITILISLICQYFWWILGNRYQYSSIDIKKSYILADQFNIFRNATVLIIWLILPYIIAISSFYIHQFSKPKIKLNSIHKQSEINEQQNEQIFKKDQFNNKQHQIIIKSEHKLHLNTDNSNLIKLLYVPLSALLSSVINLTLNNAKILFTVVYVPLTLLNIVKAVGIIFIIIIIELFKWIRQKLIAKQK